MKTDKTSEAWLVGPSAQGVIEAERAVLRQALARLFGRSLLQIGSWTPRLLETSSHWRTGVLGPDQGVDVRCDLSALPLAGGSVDAILLAHSLESAPSAHRLLREVDRALSPRGQLLVLAFNPYSIWGLRQRWLRRYPALPISMQPLGSGRVQDWLRLLDYEVLDCQRIAPQRVEFDANHQPRRWWRERRQDLVRRAPWLQLMWGFFAPVYLIQARKRRVPMSPAQKPVWRRASAGMDAVNMPTRNMPTIKNLVNE